MVLGLQWGHEGKDKLLNKLCPDYDYSCRFNGGLLTDAVQLDNGQAFKLLPHGVKFEGVTSLLGNGVVIDPNILLSDMRLMRQNSIDITGSMVISDRSSLVTVLHHRI